MKNKILSKAYGGVTEARRKLYGLGLPRQWKVITSTLLLLFTFAIGNVMAADTTYKLFYGATKDVNGTTLNSEDFFTALTSTVESNTVAGTTYTVRLGYFGGGVEPNLYNKNTNRFIRYDVKTTSVEIEVVAIAKNKNRTVKIGYVKEPGSSTTASEFSSNTLGSLVLSTANTGAKSEKISFTTAVNASIIVSASSSATDISIIQVTVTEKGTPLPKPGDDGYVFRFQQGTSTSAGAGGRHGGGKAVEIPYEGGKFVCCLNSEHTAGTGLPAKLTTKGTHYIKFTTAAYSQVNVAVGSSNAYYIADSKNPSSGTTYTADASVEIDAGTWYIVPNGSDVTIKNISFEEATPATKHHVTYDLNGATGTTPAQADVAEGAKFTLHNGTTGIVAPENKTFAGWNDGTTTYEGGAEYTMGEDDVTLTAQWATSYDISYNKGAYGTGEIAGGKKAEGVAFTLSSERFTRAGYVQVGWALADGGAKAYDLGGSYTSDATQEFFPVWAETSTYVASFACGATAPAGWTFSNAGFDADTKATADYVCTFTANNLTAPSTNGMSADAVAFAKNTNAIATFDLGAATTVTALNVTLYGGSSSAFNETIEYLGADGSTVKKEYVNSLGAGNWAANNISKTEIVDGVRYIRIHGASKWVVMSAFSVTYVDLVTKYNVTFAKNGGSGADMATLKYAENAVVTLPSCSFTPPDDHVFDGWAVTKTASGDPITVTDGKFTMPAEAVTATAQWATISDFDVKFFQGYGDPDVQIGATQVISTGEYATAPTDPERAGFAFLGWSYDATEAHIVDVATYGITAATDFTAMWKAVWTVTFDGAGAVNVEDGEAVASPNSPVMAGKVFQGWYNGESKYDFSVAVTDNLALTSKWADADPNHYVYAYNDDFHFDGVVYKTPEGAVDAGSGTSNIAMTTPYTLFAGAEGITSIVMTDGIYDSKTGAIQAVTALMKVNNNATSKLTVTIKSGYTATLKIKSSGYSATRTINVSDATPASGTTTGQAVTSGAMSVSGIGELSFALTSGSHDLTVTGGTLYIAELDIEATALPTHSVTYKPGDGEGAWVVDADATEVADCPGTFTAPTGKVFNGWKNESDDSDVAVGAIVEDDMNLIAQWINVYAVTFNMNGHGEAIDPQDIKEGAKATKPADPVADGFDFGGWFTDNGTFEAPFDFNTPIIAATPLYAKWTADPCPDKKSIVKAVMATNTTATVTGYNSNEYAGGFIINNLADDASNTNMYDFGEGEVKGFKLKGSNSAIFATLSKGGFVAGDQVVFAVTKKSDANKLAIYAAKDKDHVLKLVELDVDAAGIYTYRLTQDNIDAIEAAGSDYLSIGTFRGDYNPFIYSVELKGCREWAVSHQVTYNMMGHGTQVAPQTVPEGDKIAKPSVVEPEGWAFVGWYKENTFENEWDFTTDVMGTSDMTLYAKWEDETSAIKLIVDDATPGTKKINDEAYYTGSPLTSVTISEVVTPCVKLAGGATAATAPYGAGQNDNRVIAYCAQTTQTKIRVIAYSDTNNPRPYTISFVEEGQTADQADDNNVIINLPTDRTIHTSDWYQFNSSKNRTIYITIPGNASNYHFLQVKVIESGTPIKKAGDLGYSMNFNIGRPIGVKQTLHKNFEGFDFYANNDYKVLQSTSMVISNATNDYIKFHAAVPMTLAVTTENAASFYVTKAAKGTDNETLSTAGGISYIDLDEAADWYISPKGGDVKIQKIEFIAPKCQQPTVVDMENIGLCEGDAFTVLTVSASVSDGGTLHYQWYKHPAAGDDEAVGTDAASYTPEADGQYYVVVTNKLADHSDNSKTSNTVTIEHFASAEITTAPLNKRGEVDDVVTLSVVATGKNLSYKWFKCDDESGTNPVAIDPEETNASLNVTITAGMNQWYKVLVTSDCGNAEATARVSEFEPTAPANVTGSITWDWKSTTAGFPTENTSIDFTNTSVEELFADVDAAMPNNEYFRSDMLYGIGQRAWRKSNNDGECGFQGFQIRFNTEVAGRVRVYFRAPSSGQTSAVTIDGKPAGSRGNSWGWSEYVDVEANTNVIIAMTNGETGMTRVQKIEFEERVDQRGAGWAATGELGTVCLESDAFVTGANLYELAGLDVNGYLAFDQILDGQLEAGKPYLFEATSNALINFYAPMNAGTADQAEVTNGMHGTFTSKTFTADDESIYYFSGRHIWAVKDFIVSITIPAHYCYVDMSELQNSGASEAPAPGRRRISMSIMGSQIATGIENTGFESEAPRKVLINGELYILRGEKMYDAKGQLVK